jgi:hypothetical protein
MNHRDPAQCWESVYLLPVGTMTWFEIAFLHVENREGTSYTVVLDLANTIFYPKYRFVVQKRDTSSDVI